jgi:hypothetical protein
LLEFCRTAEPAADAPEAIPFAHRRSRVEPPPLPKNPIARNVYFARARLREGGVGFAAKQGASKLRRLASER